MSALILDSNAYSYFMGGEPAAVQALRAAHEVQLPLIVLGELLAGFAAGNQIKTNREALARFMASPRVHLMNPDEKTAQQYADVFKWLREHGRPIPCNAMWIAALARQHRMPLLTFDKHFAAIPGVDLAHPA